MTIEGVLKKGVDPSGLIVKSPNQGGRQGKVSKAWRTNGSYRVQVQWDDGTPSQVNARSLEVVEVGT